MTVKTLSLAAGAVLLFGGSYSNLAAARALLSGLWPSMDVLPAAERARQGVPLEPPSMSF